MGANHRVTEDYMGAPFKGKEATQAQIEARIALANRNRERQKHKHYLGRDERDQPMYRAPCGHTVHNPNARECWGCRSERKPPGTNVFVGRDDRGWSWWRASCGHLVHAARAKRCRSCWNKERAAKRNPRNNPYRKVPGAEHGYEHRQIAERVLGRKLKRNEVVHHINMNKADNRNRNLLICTVSYHKYLHHAMQLAYARRLGPPPE